MTHTENDNVNTAHWGKWIRLHLWPAGTFVIWSQVRELYSAVFWESTPVAHTQVESPCSSIWFQFLAGIQPEGPVWCPHKLPINVSSSRLPSPNSPDASPMCSSNTLALYSNYLIICLYTLLYQESQERRKHFCLSVVNNSWMKELCSAQIRLRRL